MKIFLQPLLGSIFTCFLFAIGGRSLGQTSNATLSQLSTEKDLFETDEMLHIKLIGNVRELVNDRTGEPKSFPFVLSYRTNNGTEDSLDIQARTRGHFRKTMGDCNYPPILLHFLKNDTLQSSIFKDQDKLKLVMPCKGEDYIIREWLVYKIYNLVTPKSFKARLVSVELYDTKKKKSTSPFYGILLEEDKQMAKRNKNVLIAGPLRPEQTDSTAFLKMAMFEYLIGNTDWSVQYQNIKLVAADSSAIPVAVPYDFDQCGVVNAPYAKPAEELKMNSVIQRRYRGYCIADMKRFDSVIVLYNNLKTDIYNLYTNCSLLDTKYIRNTIQYFDEFYKIVNDPAALQREFSYPCDKNKTGNVVIRGIKGD
jgi:hypothetical protein